MISIWNKKIEMITPEFQNFFEAINWVSNNDITGDLIIQHEETGRIYKIFRTLHDCFNYWDLDIPNGNIDYASLEFAKKKKERA